MLEFVNILLQMEAKAVKNASSLLHFSGHSELESGLLTSYISLYNEPLFSGHLYLVDVDTKINSI